MRFLSVRTIGFQAQRGVVELEDDMKKQETKIYCSLDIETSGFDPKTSDLLEVGFVFFEVAEEGIKIKEEYTQVFKPSKEVPANILGLTGISKEELETAPPFAEHRDYIQNKLRDTTIVGHNVIFDINFLKALGLEFKGAVIDTLEIVQFILPTHHSYNLENLMHVFQVQHKDAHRALADSKAAVRLLEKMLRLYWSFPERLRRRITQLIDGQPLSWKDLLMVEQAGEALPALKVKPPQESKNYEHFILQDKTVLSFPLGKSSIEDLALELSKKKEKILLVVPKAEQAAGLWKQGLAQAVFGSELQFNEKKFGKALEKSASSLEELKFLVKVLVWKETNWQHYSILDLNLSFAGGQFRELITGGKPKDLVKPRIICTDLNNFIQLSKDGLYKNRFVVIAGLSEFEIAASSGISSKVAWGFVNYLLKNFYNPELQSGDIKYKELVERLLSASDLFFGLVSALLQTDPPTFQYYKITPQVWESENFGKIRQAALNFIAKLEEGNKIFKSPELKSTAANLARFFEQDANAVKWMELAANRCVFFSSPLDISGIVQKILAPFSRTAFADSLASTALRKYFLNRLGLKNYKYINIKTEEKTRSLRQRDLFHKLKGILASNEDSNKAVIKCHCFAHSVPGKDLASIIRNESLPAAVLFGSSLQVKEFYEQNYEDLKERAFLLAQSASGGSARMFRNFSIHHNSLLIATDKFVLKHLNGIAQNPVGDLAVKTLFLCHLPFEQFTHPYQEALAGRFERAFEEFSLPRAVYNLHCLLKFFYTPALETIYLCDSKLAKPYASAFVEYLQNLPNLELVGEERAVNSLKISPKSDIH